jgi:hypothetical protein
MSGSEGIEELSMGYEAGGRTGGYPKRHEGWRSAKIFLDKQKHPPYTPPVEKQYLIKIKIKIGDKY